MPALSLSRRRAIACSLVFLTACATKPPETPEPTALDIINTRMASAVAAQQELASIKVGNQNAPKRDRTDIFEDRVTLDYVGDIEGALKRIATQYGFALEVFGKRPPEGLVVNIYIREPKAVVDVLKAIALQYPTLVDVSVGRESIELVYKKG